MDWTDVEFSSDLVQSAYLHLCFLDKVDNFEKILKGDALKHAVKRYEQLWLPLVNEHRSVEMVPPVDIHWFWYLHLLQPLAYRRDCRKMFKSTLDHRFKAESRIIPGTNKAIELWYESYPKEGYNIIRNDEYVRPRRNKGQMNLEESSKLSVDLVSLAEAHMHFCYQVALPHFRDKKYLENAEKRYKQFLCLKKLEPSEFLTPSVDILLMWYTHMCNPVSYANDLMRICGQILDNTVKIKPAPLNDKFILAREKTNELWKRVSAEELVQPGTKLRYNETQKEIQQMTIEDLVDCCVIVYKIYLAHADLQNVSASRKQQHLNLRIYRLQRERDFFEEMLHLSGNKHMWGFSTSFLYNTVEHKELKVVLTRTMKVWCVRDEREVASATVDLRQEIARMKPMERSVSFNVDMTADGSSEVIRLVLDGAVDKPQPLLCDLLLQKSNFVLKKLSKKELSTVWGHKELPDSFRNQEHSCYSASHRLLNHENNESFRCNVMHIPDLLHSGVEIIFKKRLVATSHLIGSSQLPYPSQVETQDITTAFDPELGERAMLIRNYCGDWGLCIARWSQDVDGLDVRFMKLSGKNKVQHVTVQSVDIEFQSFNANLCTGKILINPSNNTVAENLAIYWSICVLYVLCSPQSKGRQLLLTRSEMKPSDEVSDDEKEMQPVFIDEMNCQLLLAAGLTTKTPSNEYMRDRFGSLTYDLLLDAQGIIVEEHKTSRRLLKKESILAEGSLSCDSPKQKHKKRKSNLKDPEEIERKQRVFVEPKSKITTDIITNTNTGNTDTVTSDKESRKNVVTVKTKTLKSRKSSKLEDMLVMSDDSITKDDVMETKLMKDDKGRKILIRKISSRIDEQIAPSEDSLDEEIKEKNEFLKGLDVDKRNNQGISSEDETNFIERDNITHSKDKNHQMSDSLRVGESIVREETTLIKEKVEKKKRQARENDNQNERNHDSNTVIFDLFGAEVKASNSSINEATMTTQDDTRSDCSSISRAARQDRKQRITKERESRFPLSDEDPQEHSITIQKKRKRKKSKPKLDTGALETASEV